MYDLIIKSGIIVDGIGNKHFTGDNTIDNGLIAAVGKVAGAAKETSNADGQMVGWSPPAGSIFTPRTTARRLGCSADPSGWHGEPHRLKLGRTTFDLRYTR